MHKCYIQMMVVPRKRLPLGMPFTRSIINHRDIVKETSPFWFFNLFIFILNVISLPLALSVSQYTVNVNPPVPQPVQQATTATGVSHVERGVKEARAARTGPAPVSVRDGSHRHATVSGPTLREENCPHNINSTSWYPPSPSWQSKSARRPYYRFIILNLIVPNRFFSKETFILFSCVTEWPYSDKPIACWRRSRPYFKIWLFSMKNPVSFSEERHLRHNRFTRTSEWLNMVVYLHKIYFCREHIQLPWFLSNPQS